MLNPDLIFHDGSRGFNSEVKRARQSELLVPNSLSAASTNKVYFRSPAEKRAAEELLSRNDDDLPPFEVQEAHYFPDRRRVINYGFTHDSLPGDYDTVVTKLGETTRTDSYRSGRPLWYGVQLARPEGDPVLEALHIEFRTESGACIHRHQAKPNEPSWRHWATWGQITLHESCWATCWIQDTEAFSEYLIVE